MLGYLYWLLLGFMGFHGSLQVLLGFRWMVGYFDQVVMFFFLGFTEFYWGLMGFSELYWVSCEWLGT